MMARLRKHLRIGRLGDIADQKTEDLKSRVNKDVSISSGQIKQNPCPFRSHVPPPPNPSRRNPLKQVRPMQVLIIQPIGMELKNVYAVDGEGRETADLSLLRKDDEVV